VRDWKGTMPPRWRGLKAQIVLWTVLPLTLVLIGVAFTGVYSHEQSMRTLVQERDQALATVSAGQVRDLLQAHAAALNALSSEQAFHHQDQAAQQILLTQAPDSLALEEVALLDEAGNLARAGMASPTWLQDGSVPDLARAVMARQDVVLVPLVDTPGTETTFLMGAPVYDESGTTYGILAAPLSLDSLRLAALLSQVQVGEHGVVYLVDGSGEILASSPSDQARISLAGHTGLDEALQDESAGVALCQAPGGERMTLAYAPVNFGGTGWRVLVEQPWRDVIGPVLRYSQFMPLVAALAVVISLLTLYYGIRAIARPLQVLGEKAERVAWGDFEATGTPVGGVEEIEDLRRTLDQMAKRIQNYQSGMHDYIAAITRGQEEERKRLARELHDDTVQALIVLRQQTEMAQKLLPRDPERAAERLTTVRAMLVETVEGVRRFSRDLRPIYLEDLGFIPALEMLARSERELRRAGEPGAIDVQFDTAGPVRRLPPDLELAAYRIVQEALNNALQHAGASQVWVEVRFEEEYLVLSVRDDGQGFEAPDLPDALARQGHFGLMGIQERALLYGGQLTIHSTADEGTKVTVRLPYPTQGTPPNGL
jgi:two-component system sensor histidine kinase UhpB